VLKIVPSHFAGLLAAGEGQVMPRRVLVLGGEAIGVELAGRVARLAGDCRVINHYGPTEATVGCVLHELPATPPGGADLLLGLPPGGPPPIGRPLAGVQLRVVDAWGEPAPVGAVGELWVGGPGLARGYLGDPAATAERFVPDGWGAPDEAAAGGAPGAGGGGRLYRTGDRVRWRADGMLDYLGRMDDQVKIRGHRVEPGEVEAALRSLPGVRQAAVVARAEERRPETLRLVAYVVGEAGEEDRWLTALRRLLPEPMVPSALVRMESLPLTANGKVDRRSLPAPESGPGAASWEAPQTAGEQALAEIWSELLGGARVGRDDNFFELGGDSILSIQAVARARQRGLWLTPRQVFDQPTIRGLAAVAAPAPPPGEGLREAAADGRMPGDFPLARLSGDELARLAAALPDLADVYPLTPLQAGLLFHALHSPQSNAYCNQMTCTLQGELDGERLRQAWERLLARHETLRTVFVWEAVREPVQVVRRSVALPWRYEDWRGIGEAEQRRRLEQAIGADRAQGYDLERGPLQRLTLLRTGERRHVFLWSNHHLILDGWSRTLAIAELLELYAAPADGEAPRRDPVRPFRDYVAWLQGQDRGAAEAYWRERLAGLEPALVGKRTAAAAPRGGHLKRREHLDLEASRRLESFARRARVTLNTLVQAAWALTLSGLRGSDEVVFGVTVAGRPAGLDGVERMVGLFINTLPVRVRVADDGADLGGWLRELQRLAAEARQHEHSPLPDVMRWSGQPAGRPLFDSLLVFESFPASPATAAAAGLQVTDGEAIDHNNYPLTVTVRPAAPMEIEIDFIAGAVAETQVMRLLSAIAGILARMAAAGEGATVAALRQEMKAMARKEAEMATQSRRDSLLEKMRSASPQAVRLEAPLEVVELHPYAPPTTLPLLVEPRLAGVDLLAWAREHRDHLRGALHRAGALLFRGAGTPSPERLQELASIFTGDLFDENGEHPRESISGHVFTPVHFSPKHLLLWHNENSFNQRWPRLIWFCCVRPADRGGESILVDARQVFTRLPPSIRDPFVDRGVTYVRKYGEGVGRDWQEVFQTTSKAEVEQRCRRDGLELRWLDERRLVTSCRRPAVVAHSATGETCWFNQAQHWHPSCLTAEVRSSLAGAFEAGNYPRDCLYGDGTPIADSTMEAICDVYRELEVSVALHAGEILMVDNVLAAHARAPYEGERRLLVAMGELGSFAE
jgi:non-ribosomal peptide synthetase component F/aryl carrier-like protein